jgi:regulator of PEP synthase PpsR (kinase-PPPase family)
MSDTRIYIISGGVGASGEQIARTALAQFQDVDVPVIVVPLVRSIDDLRAVFDEAATPGAMIIHTLVDSDLRDELTAAARAHGVVAVDALGPVLENLSELLDRRPVGTPGLYRKLREDYFRRVEAIEFAVGHDDGRKTDELPDADIVLIGVSRAGKTPLSMYLAMRGYKTANVPLVNGIDPPAELYEIDRRRVVGLTLETERLVAYRRQRQPQLGASASTVYSDPREILSDLEFARRVFRRGRFGVVDVTSKPIEESANEVVALITRRAN